MKVYKIIETTISEVYVIGESLEQVTKNYKRGMYADELSDAPLQYSSHEIK